MVSIIYEIYLKTINTEHPSVCSEASNGFIRMDMVNVVENGSKYVIPCLHSNIHFVEKKKPKDAIIMPDSFQGNELIEKVGFDLFSCESGKGALELNEDVQYEGEIKLPHSESDGGVVILTNIQMTDYGCKMSMEFLQIFCLLQKLKNRIGWIVIPLDLDYDISNINKNVLIRGGRFIECKTPEGNYIVWTNHDPQIPKDIEDLSMHDFLVRYIPREMQE